jgi:hypothetical protein
MTVVQSSYYSGIRTEGLRNTTRNLSQGGLCPEENRPEHFPSSSEQSYCYRCGMTFVSSFIKTCQEFQCLLSETDERTY